MIRLCEIGPREWLSLAGAPLDHKIKFYNSKTLGVMHGLKLSHTYPPKTPAARSFIAPNPRIFLSYLFGCTPGGGEFDGEVMMGLLVRSGVLSLSDCFGRESFVRV